MINNRLFIRNLRMTIASICICALIGLLTSYLLALIFYRDALAFRFSTLGGIGTDRLEGYDQMRLLCCWFGAACGALIAQSLFLVEYIGGRNNAA